MVGMNRNQTAETLFGDSLLMAAPPMNVPNPRCFLSGIDASNRHIQVPFNEDMLGRHIMLLGASAPARLTPSARSSASFGTPCGPTR